VTVQELLQQSFVLFDDVFLNQYIQQNIADFSELPIAFKTKNYVALSKALMSGGSIVTFGFDYYFQIYQTDDLMPIEIADLPDHTVHLGWLYSKKNKLSRVAEEFINGFELAPSRNVI